jgi:hypothetical protein
VIKFANAGIVCLEKDDEGWRTSWILLPQMAAAAGIQGERRTDIPR